MVVAANHPCLPTLLTGGAPVGLALEKYAAHKTAQLEAWMDLISYFYDGRIFDLYELGKEMQTRHSWLPFGIFERFMSSNMAGIASGFTTASPFSRGVLWAMDRCLAMGTKIPVSKHAIA